MLKASGEANFDRISAPNVAESRIEAVPLLDPESCYRAMAARDRRFDGRFFVGVKTTGIYCRPICPARTPQRANVIFYPTAAAAQEAGFRPCLRCRPETAPHSGAWRGSSSTVSRALTLIEAGALDDGDIEGLAASVGIGGRQLRRLFRLHLGATPLAVAQTRRVLLAKQLIHDTHLPMTEVAFAAGFASLRRFNDTFHRLYRRPPSSLRRRGGAGDGSAIALRLSYRPPYDWASIIGFLAARAIPGVEIVTPELYRRSFAGGAVAVSHEPERRSLRVTVQLSDLAQLPAILLNVRRVFDLDADPDVIATHLARDPVLAPLVAKRPGLRLPGGWDGFEMAVRAVIGQQITIVGARRLLGKLVAAYGSPSNDVGDGLTHVFPTPDRLLGRNIAALGMPGARGRAIAAVAQTALDEPALFERGATLDEAITRLCAIAGVGQWTAHYLAIRALREPDAFPASDVGLLRALAQKGVRPSPQELVRRAEAWRPWRAYAAQHLWTHDFASSPFEETKNETRPAKIVVADRGDPARL